MNEAYLLQPRTRERMTSDQYQGSAVCYAVTNDLPYLLTCLSGGMTKRAFGELLATRLPESDLYPIHLAAFLGHGDTFMALKSLTPEKQTYLRDRSGNTTLHLSAIAASFCKSFVPEGKFDESSRFALLNEEGDTALDIAARSGRYAWSGRCLSLLHRLIRTPQDRISVARLRAGALRKALVCGPLYSTAEDHRRTLNILHLGGSSELSSWLEIDLHERR